MLLHLITMLSGGQVLAISGATFVGPILTNSVELYDPANETFTVSGSLSVARLDHTATLLQDGRVLVTGGSNAGNLDSAELGVITISVTKTFSAAAPKQTYSYDGGNHTLTVSFVDGVLTDFDLTITAVATVPGSLALDPLVFPPGTDCFAYATTNSLCVVYRAEEPLPSPGFQFTGSFDILIKYFDPVPAPANPRMAHDFSGIPGDDFTEDMTNAFFPSPNPDTDPALRGRTINWSRIVAVDLATDPAIFIGFLEPLGAGGKAFKSGRTIPVKFQLTDGNGNPVTDAVAHISVAKISNGEVGPLASDVEASGAANTDNLFRFGGGNYVYNLSTKGFTSGTYLLTVTSTKFFFQTVTFASRK